MGHLRGQDRGRRDSRARCAEPPGYQGYGAPHHTRRTPAAPAVPAGPSRARARDRANHLKERDTMTTYAADALGAPPFQVLDNPQEKTHV